MNGKPTKLNSILWTWKHGSSIGTRRSSEGFRGIRICVRGRKARCTASPTAGAFFVFDPVDRKVIHQRELESEFGPTTSQQGPRVFVTAPDGAIFILFTRGVAIVESDTHENTDAG